MPASSSPSRPAEVAVATTDDGLWSSCRSALEASGLVVRRVTLPEAGGAWSDGSPPDVLIVDAGGVDVSASIQAGRRSGWISGTTPVLVLADAAPERDRLLEWLQGGAWDWVRLPPDQELLTVRIRNLLLSRTSRADEAAAAAQGGYGWRGLLRVAEESLALARRHDRPLCCVALRLEDPDGGEDATVRARDVDRLELAIKESVRGSDLLGRSRSDELVMILPDTARPGAELVARRLEEFVAARLEEWGHEGRIRIAVSAASDHPDATAAAFLAAVVRRVR